MIRVAVLIKLKTPTFPSTLYTQCCYCHSNRLSLERERERGGSQRHYIWGGSRITFPALKVPRQCPFVLLVEGKALGSENGKSQSYVTNDGQSASLSWYQAPTWGPRPDIYYCQTDAGLLMWGALSDKKTGLSFTIAAGPRQRSHFRVRVP
jgi:hypothetical protein